jgi:hypothetical protein
MVPRRPTLPTRRVRHNGALVPFQGLEIDGRASTARRREGNNGDEKCEGIEIILDNYI